MFLILLGYLLKQNVIQLEKKKKKEVTQEKVNKLKKRNKKK